MINVRQITQKIWKFVCPWKEKYEHLDNLTNELVAKLSRCKNTIKQLEFDNAKLKNAIKSRDSIIYDLKTEIMTIETWHDEPPSEIPEWLNNNNQSYKGRREINEKGKTTSVKINPADLYFPRPSLIRLAASHGWENMSHDEKLMSIWRYVIKRIKYRYDASENWQEPNITNDLRYGDCEDGTILFVTLARIAKVPADKIFNALGWFATRTGKFGHSFPIAQMSDGFWYVFETTIDTVPSKPIRFHGSNYGANWGVHNWKYDGTIKEKYRQEFKVGKTTLYQVV